MAKAKKRAKKIEPAKKAIKKATKKRVMKPKSKKKISAIPKGYHSITPYLTVSPAMEAIQFYKQAFGAKEILRMDQPEGKIGHAELKIGDAKIMLSDKCAEMDMRNPKDLGGSPVGIHLYIKDVDSVVKRAIAKGAKLIKAVEDMFYGDRSGIVEDPYGHTWYISTHIENVSIAQVKKRAAALFGKK